MPELDPAGPNLKVVDPSLYLGATSTLDAVTAFEQRRDQLDPDTAEILESHGSEAIEAYGETRIYHNTLITAVPHIMRDGLRSDSELFVPSPEDVEFAQRLFREKGDFNPSTERQFARYILGTPDGASPSVYFYSKSADDFKDFNIGYGKPERLFIFAQEMGNIMAMADGPFTEAERQHARLLFEKYAALLSEENGNHIAVLRANPFNPDIFYAQLGGLPRLPKEQVDFIVANLRYMGTPHHGIAVEGTIPPEDLELMDVEIPLDFPLTEESLKPELSRFYKKPQ